MRAISAPVLVPPVNEIAGTRGCATIAAPTFGPKPCTTLSTPGGSPVGAMCNSMRADPSSALRIACAEWRWRKIESCSRPAGCPAFAPARSACRCRLIRLWPVSPGLIQSSRRYAAECANAHAPVCMPTLETLAQRPERRPRHRAHHFREALNTPRRWPAQNCRDTLPTPAAHNVHQCSSRVSAWGRMQMISGTRQAGLQARLPRAFSAAHTVCTAPPP